MPSARGVVGDPDRVADASGVGRVCALVLDCADPPALAHFWSAVLGAPVAEEESTWASLVGSPRMAFQRAADYRPPIWPGLQGEQQSHLDILADDLPTAMARVLALGATPLTDVLDPSPKEWRIFADPAGHPFCLVTTDE